MGFGGGGGKKMGSISMKMGVNAKAKPKAKAPSMNIFGAAADSDDDDPAPGKAVKPPVKISSGPSRQVQEELDKMMAADPTVFQFDELDFGGTKGMERESVKVQPGANPGVGESNKPKERPQAKYMDKLFERTSVRKIEQDIMYQRRIRKESEQEAHLYPDKEVFVTEAYKKKLAEDKEWEKKMSEKDKQDEKNSAASKSAEGMGFAGFHRLLLDSGRASSGHMVKKEEPKEEVKEEPHAGEVDSAVKVEVKEEPAADSAPSGAAADNVDADDGETERPAKVQKLVIEVQKRAPKEPEAPKAPPPKRNDETAVMSARERFLARKRAREAGGQ